MEFKLKILNYSIKSIWFILFTIMTILIIKNSFSHFSSYIFVNAFQIKDQGFVSNKLLSLSKSTSQASASISNSDNYFHKNYISKINKEIKLYAFERSFKLNLVRIEIEDFLSPKLKFLNYNNKYTIKNQPNDKNNNNFTNSKSNFKYFSNDSNCFYTGNVDYDIESLVYINLCHDKHIIGSFRINNKEYFIEPLEEFDPKYYENNEFSFVDFDDIYSDLSTHLIYTRISTSLNEKNKHSTYCAYIGDDQNKNSKKIINDEYSYKYSNDSFKNNNHNKQRVKRQTNFFPYIVDRKIYLELLVVVDKKMYEFYGDNLENHILTLMFITTQMYQHPSLINPVRVYISDIIYLHQFQDKHYENLDITWDAEKLLSNFCRWQHEYRRDTNSNNQIDVAILITKHDICKSKDVCQTLGMARLNQVCVPSQNCAVIEDSGLNTAYTIAHEIGHLLGMKHVDEERCQDLDSLSTPMMASMLDLTKKSQIWSNCSVLEFTDLLRTGDAECLFNLPEKNSNYKSKDLKFEDTLEQFDQLTIDNAIYPGRNRMYDLRNQCKQIFGPESDACDQNIDDECKILWCKADQSAEADDNSYQCVTTNTKWADGTQCGLNDPYNNQKICMNGECVDKRSEDARPIDGDWSEWSEFTKCSRSCGGGIRKKYRSCDNPKPKNGGKYCIGERVLYESCNTQDCPDKESNFREEQCRLSAQKMINSKISDQMGYTFNDIFSWKAYYSQDPRRKCVLFCKAEDKSSVGTFSMLSPLVIDGTKCSLDSYDICVNGHCLPGGCDNRLYSDKSDDNCGVCGGENKSCEQISETIDSPIKFGYSFLKTLPPKITNILIHRQRDTDDLGCLALRSNETSLLNGYYVISKTSTSINFEGKVIDYIVNDTDEIIKSKGNFSQQLIVEFLAGDKKIYNSIKFTYYVAISDLIEDNRDRYYNKNQFNIEHFENSRETEKKQSYKLSSKTNLSRSDNYGSDLTIRSQCDNICNGIQRVTFKKCKKNDSRDCKSFVENRPCNVHCYLSVLHESVGCIPHYGDCGDGIEELKINCYKISIKNSDNKAPIDLSYCDKNEIKRINATRRRCQIPCDNYEWKPIEIECSCENGYKKQNYVCFDRNSNRLVGSHKCKEVSKPSITVLERCDSSCYKWRTSDWNECSKTCGGGERRRDLYCVYNQSRLVERQYCNTEPKPIEKESCNTHSCPTWSIGRWSECYGSCDRGKRNRSVKCIYKGNEVENLACINATKPREEENCERAECLNWKVTAWSECSVSCGKGYKSRYVYCELEKRINRIRTNHIHLKKMTSDTSLFERVEDSRCEPDIKPIDKAECFVNQSCSEWLVSTWSHCNCETGAKNRLVYCSSNKADSCPYENKPPSSEKCICNSRWKTSKWSECNGGCTLGWKFRNVTCINKSGEEVNYKECWNLTKPASQLKCFDCSGEWTTTEWSECSTTCGSGIKRRSISCVSRYTNLTVPHHKCVSSLKPVKQKLCNIRECKEETYEWKIISRGPCPVSCGNGWRSRKIECLSSNGKLSNLCKKEDKPDYYEQCNAGECSKWEVGGWSTCSTDCGQGIRKRLVMCRSSDGLVLDDNKCSSLEKPTEITNCTGTFCAKWILGKWSSCDPKTCTIVRNVMCGFENGTSLPDNNCNKVEKPSYLSECQNKNFCNRITNEYAIIKPDQTSTMGVLTYTNWSRCSVKCGLGFRTRDISCRSVKNSSIELPIRFCNSDQKERLRMSCFLAVCSYKLVEEWGKCSAKCGQHGIEVLERKCYENVTKSFTDLSKCKITSFVNQTRRCYKPCPRHVKNHVFEWKHTNWKPCPAKCGFGYKNRTVYCWNMNENRTTYDSHCLLKNKPVSSLPCLNISCGYGWFVSKWSECSKTCSPGIKKRDVFCIKISKEGNIINVTSNKCDLNEKPKSTMSCNFGDCDGEYFWKTGEWSSCLPNCNVGHQRRNVHCVNRKGEHQSDYTKCKEDSMPLRYQFCFTNCYANSCLDLKHQFNINVDNDYNLNISNKIIQIYCKDMNTNEPKEYITLKSGESKNFAEIYDKKLLHPSKCRYGPRYGSNCSFCQTEIVKNHGITLFSKVRLDLATLKIIEDDFSFANFLYGNPVPFGTSGDCYSSVSECQQGRLNIDLKGTNFVFDTGVKWINYGEKPNQRIHFSKDNASVYGTCGGLCGFCKPDPEIGMKLKIV